MIACADAGASRDGKKKKAKRCVAPRGAESARPIASTFPDGVHLSTKATRGHASNPCRSNKVWGTLDSDASTIAGPIDAHWRFG